MLDEFNTGICAEKISIFLIYVMILSMTCIYGVEGHDGNRTMNVAGGRHAPKGEGL